MAKRSKKRGTLPQLLADAKRAGWSKWIRSVADERAVFEGCTFSIEHGEHAVAFFPTVLCHSKGRWAGEPFVLLDWQRDDIIMPLFGWFGPDGNRRYSQAWVEIPKKNGKSTIAAGVGLYMLSGDGEAGAEVYSVATKRDQAKIVHNEAVAMVRSSPILSECLVVNRSSHSIQFRATGSSYTALAAEAHSLEGLNIHAAICDEVHVWRGRSLYESLRYGISARDNPLIFYITTAGDSSSALARELHDQAAAILDGSQEDSSFFSYIRAADADVVDRWPPTEADVEQANPSLGETLRASVIQKDIDEATRVPSKRAAFLRYRLNIWGQSVDQWIQPHTWSECKSDFTADDLEGRECFAGLDLAMTRDTSSLVLVFPPEDATDPFYLLPYFWLPRDRAVAQSKVVPWLTWAEAGELELMPGKVADHAFIRRAVCELSERFIIRELAYDDRYAETITQEIEAETGIERIKFPQTMPVMCGPTRELERLILSQSIRHNGHSLLTWQFGNAKLKVDASGNGKPMKPAPDDERKIDGVIASIMALARAIESQSEVAGGVYVL